MQLIQNGTQVGSLGAGPAAPVAAVGTPGWGNNVTPGPGVTPTDWDPDVANAALAELVNLVVGPGLTLSPGTFNQALQGVRRMAAADITSISSSPGSALTADNAGLVLVDATAGNIAITLPAAAGMNGLPIELNFERVDASANTVTIALAGSDKWVRGSLSASYTLGPMASLGIRSNGSNGWLVVRQPGGVALITSSGTFTVPIGVSLLKEVWIVGGGGGSSTPPGGGGGAGGAAILFNYAVTPGGTFPCTIGAAGTTNTYPTAGTNGGTTSFGSVASATGGVAGAAGPGSGGVGSGGTVNVYGASGTDYTSYVVQAPGAPSLLMGFGDGADSSGNGATSGVILVRF